jgi:hypothetical protein
MKIASRWFHYTDGLLQPKPYTSTPCDVLPLTQVPLQKYIASQSNRRKLQCSYAKRVFIENHSEFFITLHLFLLLRILLLCNMFFC